MNTIVACRHASSQRSLPDRLKRAQSHDAHRSHVGNGSARLVAHSGRARLPARAAGFSLLEVLAAFVILALVGTALFRSFLGALGNATLSDEYSRATLYAESRLATIGVEAPLKEGTAQGTSDDGHYAWTAAVSPYQPPGSTPDLDSAATTMAVQLWKLAVDRHVARCAW